MARTLLRNGIRGCPQVGFRPRGESGRRVEADVGPEGSAERSFSPRLRSISSPRHSICGMNRPLTRTCELP